MLTPHGGGRGGLEIRPGLWAGNGLVRGGAGTALVGSRQKVADPIKEYQAVGVEECATSCYPHLGRAYRFGGGVLLICRQEVLGRRTRARRRSGCRTVGRGTPAC